MPTRWNEHVRTAASAVKRGAEVTAKGIHATTSFVARTGVRALLGAQLVSPMGKLMTNANCASTSQPDSNLAVRDHREWSSLQKVAATACLFLLGTNALAQQMMKCTDRDGKIRYATEASRNDPSCKFLPNISSVPPLQTTKEQDSAAYFGGAGKKISLNFQNTEIRVFLQVFSEFTGKTFYPDPAVTGSANLVVTGRPWNEAFLGMLQANRLAVIKVQSGFYVFPETMTDQLAVQRAAKQGL